VEPNETERKLIEAAQGDLGRQPPHDLVLVYIEIAHVSPAHFSVQYPSSGTSKDEEPSGVNRQDARVDGH
jgi:hypothetical protein